MQLSIRCQDTNQYFFLHLTEPTILKQNSTSEFPLLEIWNHLAIKSRILENL